jgi:hypothetical protein
VNYKLIPIQTTFNIIVLWVLFGAQERWINRLTKRKSIKYSTAEELRQLAEERVNSFQAK